MFNWRNPTVQLLGRWQPWHEGHTALFKEAHKKTGQVAIMCRDVYQIDENNPYGMVEVHNRIENTLTQEGFTYYEDFVIMEVPNIVDISYGRDVGYSLTKHDLGEEIHQISATKIRNKI